MIRSLSEVQALAKTASRGAGMSWSLAADTAYATRFLCSFGFDGTGMLAQLLDDMEAGTDFTPTALHSPFIGRSGRLHPVLCGLTVCDLGSDLILGSVDVHALCCPIFTLPFLAQIKLPEQQYLIANTATFTVCLGEGGIWFDGALSHGDQNLRITRSDTQIGVFCAFSTRAQINPPVWDALSLLSARTHAPATEESRALGAGSGLSDND